MIQVRSRVGGRKTRKRALAGMRAWLGPTPKSNFRIAVRMMLEQKKILIVEDEPELRELLGEVFRLYRCQVEFAETLAESEAAIGHQDFDLVIADHRLKDEAAGLKLFEMIQVLSPATRFVLMSGYPDDVLDGLAESGMIWPTLLTKPFSLEQFRRTVESMMAQAA